MVSVGVTAKKLKRFYTSVDIEFSAPDKGYVVLLDKRKLKSPKGHVLATPNEFLANLIGLEWDSQDALITRSGMHMTSLAFTAMDDASGSSRKERTDNIISHLATDTLLYRHEIPTELFEFQKKHWDPVIQWFESRFGSKLKTTLELERVEQPAETTAAVRAYVDGLSTWGFEGYVYAVENARSVIIGLHLIEGHINAEQATYLANLETEFQIARWGSVEWGHETEKLNANTRLASTALFARLSSSSSSS